MLFRTFFNQLPNEIHLSFLHYAFWLILTSILLCKKMKKQENLDTPSKKNKTIWDLYTTKHERNMPKFKAKKIAKNKLRWKEKAAAVAGQRASGWLSGKSGWASEWTDAVTDDKEWDHQSTRLPRRVSNHLGASPRLRSPWNDPRRFCRSPQSRRRSSHGPALSHQSPTGHWRAPQPLMGASPWGQWSPPQPRGSMWSWLSYWSICARCPGGFPLDRPTYCTAAHPPKWQQGGASSCCKALSGAGTHTNTHSGCCVNVIFLLIKTLQSVECKFCNCWAKIKPHWGVVKLVVQLLLIKL